MNTMTELRIRNSPALAGQKGDDIRQRFGFSWYKPLSSMEWVYGPIFACISFENLWGKGMTAGAVSGEPIVEHGKHEITVNVRCPTAVRRRVRLHTRQRIRCNGGLRDRAKQHHV